MKSKSKFNEFNRIIWAIALKDIVDAIKNKLVLGIIIGVGFMMLSSQALPLLLKNNSEPRDFFFEEDRSTVLKKIVRSRELDFFPTDSMEELRVAVGSSAVPVLGLIIPENFDRLVENSASIVLQGYRIHWAESPEVVSLIAYFEGELSDRVGRKIRIHLVEEKIYPDSDTLGFTIMIVTGLVIGVMTLGLILVPILVLDEKENHTLEALLISPAKTYHLLIGKSIVGIFYSMVAALVMFVFTWRWIVQWDVVLLAVVLGSLSTVSVGLLLGSTFENFTTVNMWVGLTIVAFMAPVFLWTSIVSKLNPTLRVFFQSLPSVAMANMVNISFTNLDSKQEILANSLVMVAFSMVILVLVGWRISKGDN